MIPKFPEFKKIELSDKKNVEKLTSKFPSNSDFNFSNLWAWDLKGEMGLSILNNNLVVKFIDYVNGQPFFSFLGDHMVNETARDLIMFSEKHHQINFLKLITEEIATILAKSGFKTIPDRDSYDYIYSIPHLASVNVWPKNSLSKKVRQFIKKYPDYVIKQNSIQEISKDEYLEMFKKWAENKNITNHFELNEYKAFKKILEINNKNIKVVSFYLKDILIGFSVFEIVSTDYAISHFAKADISYHSSVFGVLSFEEAKILKNQGIKYYNWQPDLGIVELRYSKEKLKPAFFLKKFFISK